MSKEQKVSCPHCGVASTFAFGMLFSNDDHVKVCRDFSRLDDKAKELIMELVERLQQ